jgi:TctA family transporter
MMNDFEALKKDARGFAIALVAMFATLYIMSVMTNDYSVLQRVSSFFWTALQYALYAAIGVVAILTVLVLGIKAVRELKDRYNT